MAVTEWLIDKSAFVHIGTCVDAAAWARRIERGLVRVATPTILEIGYSARRAHDFATALRQPPLGRMPVQYMDPVAEDRAVEVLRELSQRGRHRAPSVPDLLLAATAEVAGLTILHLDKDFELIAEVTGQPVERLAPEPTQ